MELGESVWGWIIKNSDNRGLDNRGSTVIENYQSDAYLASAIGVGLSSHLHNNSQKSCGLLLMKFSGNVPLGTETDDLIMIVVWIPRIF